MTSFTSIPFEDIKSFLFTNNQIIPSNELQAYIAAWNLLKQDISLNIPSSIIDFFIASTLNKTNIPTYKTSEILISSDDNLTKLATNLTLSYVDKSRIIRILGYIHRLDNDLSIFDAIPDDVLSIVLSNLDCDSMLSICNISDTFTKFCQRKLTPILRENLKTTKNFNINSYSKEELVHLCKFLVFNN